MPLFEELHDFLRNLRNLQGVMIPFSSIAIPFALVNIAFILFAPEQAFKNFELTIFLSPVWLPPIVLGSAWRRWVQSRRYEFNNNQQWVLLEIKLPRESRKTPIAMEAFLSNIHLTHGEGTWYKRYWLGRTRTWFSFEIVSLGGRVHLYIWTRKPFRHVIETYLYAQYPGVEIVEATDYTRLIDPTSPPYQMWGCEYKKKIEDPFPIKTYIDYGLDKVPVAKPEEATDPFAHILEFMGSLSPHEQLWVHIMVRYSTGEKYGNKKNKAGKSYTWYDEGVELIEKIKTSTVRKTTYVDPVTGVKRESEGFPNPSKGQAETMAAIGKNTDKLCFDVGIRSIYFAREGHFRDYIGNFVTQIFRPFSSASQQITPLKLWSESFNDFPWEDPKKIRYAAAMKRLLEYGRRRSYFHYPYVGPWMQMSTEELASIFHIPGSNVKTPNMARIQSATAGAPHDLPV